MTRHVREDPYSIVVEYGEGAYGPTIHLDVLEQEPLLKLRTVFVELSRAAISDLELLGERYVESSGIAEFHLRLRNDDQAGARSGVRRAATDKSFIWTSDAEGWAECAELIDGLLATGVPGHQYLAEGDALVELDFNESP